MRVIFRIVPEEERLRPAVADHLASGRLNSNHVETGAVVAPVFIDIIRLHLQRQYVNESALAPRTDERTPNCHLKLFGDYVAVVLHDVAIDLRANLIDQVQAAFVNLWVQGTFRGALKDAVFQFLVIASCSDSAFGDDLLREWFTEHVLTPFARIGRIEIAFDAQFPLVSRGRRRSFKPVGTGLYSRDFKRGKQDSLFLHYDRWQKASPNHRCHRTHGGFRLELRITHENRRFVDWVDLNQSGAGFIATMLPILIKRLRSLIDADDVSINHHLLSLLDHPFLLVAGAAGFLDSQGGDSRNQTRVNMTLDKGYHAMGQFMPILKCQKSLSIPPEMPDYEFLDFLLERYLYRHIRAMYGDDNDFNDILYD